MSLLVLVGLLVISTATPTATATSKSDRPFSFSSSSPPSFSFPSSSPPSFSFSSPQPPQTYNNVTINDETLTLVLKSLHELNHFKIWSTLLNSTYNASHDFPIYSTLLVPMDDIAPFIPAVYLPFYIIPTPLSFYSLQEFPPSSTLPTLIPRINLFITNTSSSNFTINNTLILFPDILLTRYVSVHGVSSCLTYLRSEVPSSPTYYESLVMFVSFLGFSWFYVANVADFPLLVHPPLPLLIYAALLGAKMIGVFDIDITEEFLKFVMHDLLTLVLFHVLNMICIRVRSFVC